MARFISSHFNINSFTLLAPFNIDMLNIKQRLCQNYCWY